MHYRVHSTKVKCLRWYPTKAEAIAAFERASKRMSIAPPLHYPRGASGDCITTSELAYPRPTRAAGMREGHGWVSVDTSRSVEGQDLQIDWIACPSR